MRAISREMRELVIYQAEKLGWNTSQIATALNLHIRSVQRIKKLYDDVGLVISEHNGPLGRPKLMSEDNLNVWHDLYFNNMLILA
jgi:transposase